MERQGWLSPIARAVFALLLRLFTQLDSLILRWRAGTLPLPAPAAPRPPHARATTARARAVSARTRKPAAPRAPRAQLTRHMSPARVRPALVRSALARETATAALTPRHPLIARARDSPCRRA